MGAGKSSIGRKVARELALAFTDTDTMIIREHGPIAALFEAHGETHFRALERVAVTTALETGGVVALGGGAVLDPETRADLAQHRVVLLTVTPEIVKARIGGGSRPLLTGGDAVTRWETIYAQRRALYEEVADVTFDSSVGHVSAVAAAIARWARENGASTDPRTIPETS